MTARHLARELEVSVRTVYRDLEVLGAAGVPVRAESGPGGGCQLLDGYRFPLRGLRPEEAEALLILGVPSALRDLGLDGAATAAHRQIRVTAGTDARPLVHLDLPRWFRGHDEVPHLRTLAEALRRHRHLALGYRRADGGPDPDPGPDPGPDRGAAPARVVGPLGLVNKAGTWYLVAAARGGQVTVFRAGRIASARLLAEPFARPADFELTAFWERWSAEFMTSRPRLQVRLRASPPALAALREVFGDGGAEAVAAAPPPDEQGWRELRLSFEHELAAAHRLAGFGGQVEVMSPASVREKLLATAQGILDRYGGPVAPAAPAGSGTGAGPGCTGTSLSAGGGPGCTGTSLSAGGGPGCTGTSTGAGAGWLSSSPRAWSASRSAVPRAASTAISVIPQAIAASAMLNAGQSRNLIQSTTQPCSGPGDRNSRSARLPIAPPSSRPSATAHGALPMCREYPTMITATPAAMAAQAAVNGGPPMPSAAPGLRATSRVSGPPNSRTCRRPDSSPTTVALLPASAASTIAAIPTSTAKRRRGAGG
jgi:predicted DNA-binding transcriptional regulator YafY